MAKDIVLNIPHSINNPFYYLKDLQRPNTSFYFADVTFNELRDIVDNLKNKPSRDIYGFSVKLIKAIKHLTVIPLTKLINICFSQNIFPAKLKTAVIIPVFKKGHPALPENYRPISLLPIISKIFEKCMAIRIAKFFESHLLFSRYQFGFRENRNTTLAIIHLVSEILDGFQNMKYTSGLFCDLSKAFDCVDHGIL
nr:unnamed protein product [Callosobruchus analis]